MYQVFLIDDQKLIIDSMKEIIDWSYYGFEVADTFNDGLDAYEAIKINEPDLIIVDIEMPMMTGLELSSLIKSDSRHTRILILSAYDNFNYAKASISNGVDGYLLKPIDEKELADALIAVKIELDSNNERIYKDKILDKLSKHISINHHQMFKEAYLNKTSDEMLLDFLNSHNAPRECSHIKFLEMYLTRESDIDDVFLLQCVDSSLALFGDRSCFFVDNHTIIAIIANDGNRINPINNGLIKKNIYISLWEYNIKAIINLVDMVNNNSNISNAFERMNQNRSKHFFENDSTQNDYKDVVFSGAFKMPSQLLENINLKNKEEVLSMINSQFDQIMKEKSYSKDCIIDYFSSLINIIEEQLINKGMMVGEKTNLFYSENYNEMAAKVRNKVIDYMTHISEIDNQNYIVSLAKEIARDRFGDELTLDVLCQELNITKSYFCNIFKEETNETFWEYLTNIRVQFAKRLLLSEMKMIEIANQVGYETAAYFSKVFKRSTGMTPTEYRKYKKSLREK